MVAENLGKIEGYQIKNFVHVILGFVPTNFKGKVQQIQTLITRQMPIKTES